MNILKKRGVAILITFAMIVVAIGIGQVKKPSTTASPEPEQPGPVAEQTVPGGRDGYVYDEAGVLSASTEDTLAQRNAQLQADLGAVIAVVTCNYNRSNLGSYAIDYADNIGLGGYDFIVVLDISGDNYWLVQGAALVDDFTDDDCSNYAWSCMETDFARGDYDSAVLSLTQALADWYYNYK